MRVTIPELSLVVMIGPSGSGKSTFARKHYLTACMEAYVIQVEQAVERLKSIGAELDRVAQTDPWREKVERLVSFRGIKSLSALTLLAEIGDFRRFEHPRKLMGYVGLVPNEYSSGGSRRQGGITKTGNRHVQRVLIEASWQYRHRPLVQGDLKKRSAAQPKWVRDESWKAQERLHRRYMRLVSRGKRGTVAVVAVARELAGFVWALMTKEPSIA